VCGKALENLLSLKQQYIYKKMKCEKRVRDIETE
jgi:hypothetical protein